MSTKIDLKKLERKAYLSYHRDGMLELYIGVITRTFGIGLFTPVIRP